MSHDAESWADLANMWADVMRRAPTYDHRVTDAKQKKVKNNE